MGTPTDLMTPEQRVEYNRLVIEIAATKTEIASIRERIRGTADAATSRVSVHEKHFHRTIASNSACSVKNC